MNESYIIYTHDETGLEQEFEIKDIEGFLKNNQDSLPTLVEELQNKVSFQMDLKFCIEGGIVECFDKKTCEVLSDKEAEYLKIAIESNLRVISKIRAFLGMDPEPVIKKDSMTSTFKSKANLN